MPYSYRKIQLVASRLFYRYNHLFVDSVEVSWSDISVLDEIPLDWVKIWEEYSENLGWGQSLEGIQEENRLLHLGWVIGAGVGEDGADEKLNEAKRRRVVEKKSCGIGKKKGIYRRTRRVIVGKRKWRGEKNWEKIEWSPAYIQQSGNDDEHWDKEIEEHEERLSILKDFVDR